MCPHCGLPLAGYATIGGTRVCHTVTLGRPDCYRRVTVDGEQLGVLLDVTPLPAGIRDIRQGGSQ